MLRLHLVLLSLIFVGSFAEAFIPTVPVILREVFDGRKSDSVEWVWRHRIETPDAGPVEIEERFLSERNRTYFIWRVGGVSQPVGGVLEKLNYRVGERTFSSHGLSALKYFTARSGDEFRDWLIAEGFLRRDQLAQFKPGFNLEGDPATWQMRENYLRHQDIFLSRISQNLRLGVTIGVNGTDENGIKKTVFFDRALRGARRFEWRETDKLFAWNLEGLAPLGGIGTFPRRMVFEIGNNEVIKSDLVQARPLKGRQASEFIVSAQSAEKASSLPSKAESGLRILLSYR